jgi:hypothetical protein
MKGVNRLIASYTKMTNELEGQRGRVGPEKFIPEKVGVIVGDKKDIVEQRNTANSKIFNDETTRIESVSQLYNDVNDYIGLLKQEKHALEIDIKIPLTAEKWRTAETAGAELQRLSIGAKAELTTGVQDALNQLIEVMGVGDGDIKGSNKQIAAALHKKVEMGKNTGISSSHAPLGYLGVRDDGLTIQKTYDVEIRPHLRKVLPAWLFQPDNPVANVIAQALKAQRYWGDATVVGKSPTFLTAARVTDETGILKGVHTITVPEHMSRDTYQAAQTSRWDAIEMSSASTSVLRAFTTGTDGFGATEIQKYKFSTLNVDVQWNSPSKLAIWLDTQFTRHMMVNIEKVVYNKEPKWTKDSIMNELNSKVLAEQAELAQVLFGNVLIEKTNGDIEITSKTAHRDNLDYYIRYLNSPHASSLATGCRTEYWDKRYDEILTEISRVKNGKDERITFAKVFVYDPINWVGSSITGTLKGAIGVVGDGVLSPVLGALGTGLFTTVQSSLGLQDAHYLLQLSAAAFCYYIILPAIISVTGAGGVVKNKITQGLLRWTLPGSANPEPDTAAIPGSPGDTTLNREQIEDATREERRLIEANQNKTTKEEELGETIQQIADGKIAIDNLNTEMHANAQKVEHEKGVFRNLADHAELAFLRDQARIQAAARHQQVTPYNRRRRQSNQSPAAGGADSDPDIGFGGGKRANKKRATKKHGKRKSKRNAKDGARKTKTTRKKTTRKKRRGKK